MTLNMIEYSLISDRGLLVQLYPMRDYAKGDRCPNQKLTILVPSRHLTNYLSLCYVTVTVNRSSNNLYWYYHPAVVRNLG